MLSGPERGPSWRWCERISARTWWCFEPASILFGGGFPRRDSEPARRAQRAIFRVQRELERMEIEQQRAAIVLCDRGTVDGLAYWPGLPVEFFREMGTTLDAELARYSAVIHLRTPEVHGGYDHRNPVRTETAHQAHDELLVLRLPVEQARVAEDDGQRVVDLVRHAGREPPDTRELLALHQARLMLDQRLGHPVEIIST